jgi:hypothetical protein
MLWLWDETWYGGGTRVALSPYFPNTPPLTHDSHRPELLHPFASAIDEPELKAPEEMVRVSFRFWAYRAEPFHLWFFDV